MINRDELVQIGQFRKPHGIQGEITFSFTNDSFATGECDFLICEMDGIFVPFHIENYRFISDASAFVQLKDIDSDKKARAFAHKEVFFPLQYFKENMEDDSFSWDYFIGFTLTEEQFGKIGRIVKVDKTTINTLFIVEREKEEILIPAVEEFIIRINENQKELIVALPEGLFE